MGLIDNLLPYLAVPLTSPELTVIQERLSPASMLWTLYGIEAERFIAHIISERAIDQKFTADKIAEQVIGRLFLPSTQPLFNIHLLLDRELRFDQIKRDFGSTIEIDSLERAYQTKDPKYIHIEVDGALYLHLHSSPNRPKIIAPRMKKSTISHPANFPDYTLIEIKLFTAPLDDPLKSLRRHLQTAYLENYFDTRHLFGLIGFSYLRHSASPDPIPPNDPVFFGKVQDQLPPFWAIHFFLCDRTFLTELPTAPTRASAIHAAIEAHQCQIPHGLDPKEYKYGFTYNIVKVLYMNAIILELENELATERKAKEQALKANEQALKANEQAREQAEKYRQKLLARGISPDED